MATIQQKIDEFCTNGNLESYRQVLTRMFKRIYNEGCSIAAFYVNDETKHADGEEQCGIKIQLPQNQDSNLYDQPEEIMLIILHEFGHHLDGKPDRDKMDDLYYRFEREKRAWSYAESELDAYEELRSQKDTFTVLKKKSLQTYSSKLKEQQ